MKQCVGAIFVAKGVDKKVSESLQVDCNLDIGPSFDKISNSCSFWL